MVGLDFIGDSDQGKSYTVIYLYNIFIYSWYKVSFSFFEFTPKEGN